MRTGAGPDRGPPGCATGEFFNRQAGYRPHQRSRLIAWLAIARVRSRDAASHPTPSSARKGIGHGVEAAPLAALRDRVRRSRWSSDPAMQAASRNGVNMWLATVADRMPAEGPLPADAVRLSFGRGYPIEDSHLTPATVRSSRHVCVVPSSPNADMARCILSRQGAHQPSRLRPVDELDRAVGEDPLVLQPERRSRGRLVGRGERRLPGLA
jgi:hypothetical protein